ncbi:MAG: hypothetical protein K2P21_10460 [Lachnospiraceae bacterium]|nr:hypothetical protein [Lachnospiraceae bacterium]
MKEVDKFKEFFRSQFQESWNGIAQQIHLIPEYPEEILWEFNDFKQNYLIDTGKKKFGLNCIVTVRFREAVAGKKEYRDWKKASL